MAEAICLASAMQLLLIAVLVVELQQRLLQGRLNSALPLAQFHFSNGGSGFQRIGLGRNGRG